MRNPIIDQLTKESISKAPVHPEVSPGDTVSAAIRIKEGLNKDGQEKERLQLFEGVVVAKRNRGIGSSITIRKISHNVGVERVIPLHSPTLAELKVIRRGKVRRAKLYYLRDLKGKAARIKEKIAKRVTDKAS